MTVTLKPTYYDELKLCKTLGIPAENVDPSDLSVGEKLSTVRAKFLLNALHASDSLRLGKPLVIHDTLILGSLCLCNLKIDIDIELIGCRILGKICANRCEMMQLILKGTTLNSLQILGSTLKGDLILSYGFKALGPVNLMSSNIDGMLGCTAGHFLGSNLALKLENTKVHGAFFWRQISHTNGFVDLTCAKIDTLVDDEGSWPRAGHVVLDGFVYDRIASNTHNRFTQRENWLLKQPHSHLTLGLRTQPFIHTARTLEHMGYDDEAKEIRIKLRRLKRKARLLRYFSSEERVTTLLQDNKAIGSKTAQLLDLPHRQRSLLKSFFAVFRYAMSLLHELLSAFGYKPYRVITWSFIIIALFAALYYDLNVDFSGYSKNNVFGALLLSADIFLPVIDLASGNNSPSGLLTDNDREATLRTTTRFQTLLGWIWVGLLTQSLSMLLTRPSTL